MSAQAIQVDGVSKRYGARWALVRTSLQINAGESVMLTGHNGSGKTTLLRLMAGLTAPSVGALRVFDRDVVRERQAARTAVALLSHQSGHYDDLSAAENLRLHAALLGRDPQAIDELLARVRLRERADTPVRQFSAGMKKRLSLARVMLKRPKIVLLDEPFGELDPEGMADVETWIAEERKAGTTIVLATHWIDQGRRLSDREVRLTNGRLV